MGDYVPTSRFLDYKYHIDIDGNSNSWPGLFSKLLTGSPVLKVASEGNCKQWYYDGLRPWHNFVPVSADLSDLRQIIERIYADPQLAENIGNNGRNFALGLDYCDELNRAIPTIDRLATDCQSFKESR